MKKRYIKPTLEVSPVDYSSIICSGSSFDPSSTSIIGGSGSTSLNDEDLKSDFDLGSSKRGTWNDEN